MLRWFDESNASTDHGFGIDDLIVTWETSSPGDEFYVWNRTTVGDYPTAANWTPARTTPAATDRIVFNVGANALALAVNAASETVDQFIVSNLTNLSLAPVAVNTTITVSNTATIDAGSTLNLFSMNLALSNATTSFSGAGALFAAGASEIRFAAATPVFPTGTITLSSFSVVDYNGDRNQTVLPRTDYANLRFSGATTARVKTLGAGDLTASGGIIIGTNNTFSLGALASTLTLSSVDSSFSGAGTLDLSGAAHTLNVSDQTVTWPSTLTPGTTSTVNLARAGAQAFDANTFANLGITGTGDKTPNAPSTVNRYLFLTAGNLVNGTTNVTLPTGSILRRSGGTIAAVPNYTGEISVQYTATVTQGPELPLGVDTLTLLNSGNVLTATGPLVIRDAYALRNTNNRVNMSGNALTLGTTGLGNYCRANTVSYTTGQNAYFFNLPGNSITAFVNDVAGVDIVVPLGFGNTLLNSVNRRVTVNFAPGPPNNSDGDVLTVTNEDFQLAGGHPGVSETVLSGTPLVDPLTSNVINSASQISNIRWDIRGTGALTAAYSITLAAQGVVDGNGVPYEANDPTNLRILKRADNNSSYAIQPGWVTATSLTGNASVNHTGLTGFSQFTLGVLAIDLSILPVSWVGISARREAAAGAEVSWSVARELNNERFEVQRSSSERFTSFTTVTTLPGRGTSDQPYTYRITDADAPTAGRTYYRIRQVDFDGTSSLSPIAALDGVGNWSVYPNPITGPLSVVGVGVTDATEPVAVQLLSNDGRLLVDAVLPAAQLGARLDAALVNAAAGLYVIRVGGRTVRVVKP